METSGYAPISIDPYSLQDILQNVAHEMERELARYTPDHMVYVDVIDNVEDAYSHNHAWGAVNEQLEDWFYVSFPKPGTVRFHIGRGTKEAQ